MVSPVVLSPLTDSNIACEKVNPPFTMCGIADSNETTAHATTVRTAPSLYVIVPMSLILVKKPDK